MRGRLEVGEKAARGALLHLTPGSAPERRVGGDEADALRDAVLRGERSSRASAWPACRTSRRPTTRSSPPRQRRRRRGHLERHEVPRADRRARRPRTPGMEDVCSRRTGRGGLIRGRHSPVTGTVPRHGRSDQSMPGPRATSNRKSAAATLTLSDSTRPASGIATSTSHCRRTSGRMPLPSAPRTRARRPRSLARHRSVAASATAAYAQSSRPHIRDEAREVGHHGYREMLDSTRRGATDRRRHPRGAMRGQHEAGRSRAIGAATDRRGSVGDAVQADEEGCGRPASS